MMLTTTVSLSCEEPSSRLGFFTHYRCAQWRFGRGLVSNRSEILRVPVAVLRRVSATLLSTTVAESRFDPDGQSRCQDTADNSLLQPEQHTEPFAHIGHDVSWSLRLEHESSRLPIEVLDVIRENDSGNLPAGRQ